MSYDIVMSQLVSSLLKDQVCQRSRFVALYQYLELVCNS